MTATYAASAPGEKLLIKFGNGADPETFAAACSINTDRSVEWTSDSTATVIPRCDDPTQPGKTIRRIKSTDKKISGAGVTDMASMKTLLQLFPGPVNMQVTQDADNGWTLTGPFNIDSLKTGGGAKDEQTFDISLSQADEGVLEFT